MGSHKIVDFAFIYNAHNHVGLNKKSIHPMPSLFDVEGPLKCMEEELRIGISINEVLHVFNR